MDEATSALDPISTSKIEDLAMELKKRYTIIMVTHNMQHALDYGTRLLMMDGGEIILDIGREEKERLTMDNIVEKFRQIKKQSIVNDQMLLQ